MSTARADEQEHNAADRPGRGAAAWDGDPDNPDPRKQIPPILAGFTFHEGRHTHRT